VGVGFFFFFGRHARKEGRTKKKGNKNFADPINESVAQLGGREKVVNNTSTETRKLRAHEKNQVKAKKGGCSDPESTGNKAASTFRKETLKREGRSKKHRHSKAGQRPASRHYQSTL